MRDGVTTTKKKGIIPRQWSLVVGRVEALDDAAAKSKVTVRSEYGEFEYSQ